MNLYVRTIRAAVKVYPDILPLLKGRARWVAFADGGEYKTYDYYLQQLTRLITSVYNGNLAGEFIDIMANLIQGQIYQAVNQAWLDSGMDGELPDYLAELADNIVLSQYDHVDQLYRDIVDARLDGTPLGPLLARAPLWATRWNEAYNQAMLAIAAEMGERMVWRLGATEKHCRTCAGLNGVVAYASEWETLGIQPQNAPNDALECGGWRCDCSLEVTDQRRSPNAFETIMNVTTQV